MVRLGKKWRNHAELKPLKSFTIELVMAYILDQEGVVGSIEARFRRFLLYVAQSGLKDTIHFPENATPLGTFTDPVVILDPVCSQNNVASRSVGEGAATDRRSRARSLGNRELRIGRERHRDLERDLRAAIQSRRLKNEHHRHGDIHVFSHRYRDRDAPFYWLTS